MILIDITKAILDFKLGDHIPAVTIPIFLFLSYKTEPIAGLSP